MTYLNRTWANQPWAFRLNDFVTKNSHLFLSVALSNDHWMLENVSKNFNELFRWRISQHQTQMSIWEVNDTVAFEQFLFLFRLSRETILNKWQSMTVEILWPYINHINIVTVCEKKFRLPNKWEKIRVQFKRQVQRFIQTMLCPCVMLFRCYQQTHTRTHWIISSSYNHIATTFDVPKGIVHVE